VPKSDPLHEFDWNKV